mmetsp:Transcript_54146/g.132373  ORF Transcript_54146/g.132373 Transcript_54146/m.132373 type:complete len:377 (+) Transcript_54146:169-1299(+)
MSLSMMTVADRPAVRFADRCAHDSAARSREHVVNVHHVAVDPVSLPPPHLADEDGARGEEVASSVPLTHLHRGEGAVRLLHQVPLPILRLFRLSKQILLLHYPIVSRPLRIEVLLQLLHTVRFEVDGLEGPIGELVLPLSAVVHLLSLRLQHPPGTSSSVPLFLCDRSSQPRGNLLLLVREGVVVSACEELVGRLGYAVEDFLGALLRLYAAHGLPQILPILEVLVQNAQQVNHVNTLLRVHGGLLLLLLLHLLHQAVRVLVLHLLEPRVLLRHLEPVLDVVTSGRVEVPFLALHVCVEGLDANAALLLVSPPLRLLLAVLTVLPVLLRVLHVLHVSALLHRRVAGALAPLPLPPSLHIVLHILIKPGGLLVEVLP